MTTSTIATWLLTYLIHSTIILVAVLVVSRLMGNRMLAVQEGLLRTALVGGLLTATAQLGFGIAPVTGDLDFPILAIPSPAATANLNPTHAVEPAPVGPAHSSGPTWATALIALWLVASISALAVVLRSIIDLKRLLQTRCFQPAGHMVEKLAAAVGLRRRVRVSTSRAIAVPFATGITQPEVCCPERVNELAHEHQRGLFAHELAHLARHDPAWQLLYRLGEATFSMQPLNRLVRRRLEEIAEHLTDERAVAGTGDRLGLARCLVVVAHWGSAAPIGLPATTFAAGPRLDRRVRRLLSGATENHSSGGWAVAVAVALLIGSVSILPAIGVTPAHAAVNSSPDEESSARTPTPEDTNRSSDVTSGKTWSNADDRPADAPPPAADPPAPPVPVLAAPKVAPVPEALPAPASPPAAPAAETLAPPAQPVSAPSPMPSTVPAPAAAPNHPEPATAPRPSQTERRSDEQEARERAQRSAEQRVQIREEQRVRAEAMVREQRVIAREQAQEARRLAEEAARLSRVSEADRAEIRIQVRERQAVAQREARESALAECDRARALAEAERTAREAIIAGERITDEQREELRRRVVELREQAEIGSREAAKAARARARALADEARRLAEQAEAERLELEKEKQQR